MTTETEGLSPEPSETLADVNTQAPTAESDAANEGGEGNAEKAEAELTDEDFYKLFKDKRYQKRFDEEVDKKSERQKAANRAQSKKIEELVAEVQRLRTEKPNQKPVLEDFKTYEEYQDALAEHKAEDKFRARQKEEAERRLQETEQANLDEKRESFLGKEAEVIKADPEYHANTAKVAEFIDLLPKDQNGQISDPGFKAFSKYLALEAENGPALLNHLGKNPDKIEALFGKPPAWITRKLGEYEKELTATPKTPETQPLPKPPSGIRGTSRNEKSPENMSADDLLKLVRS